MSGTVPPAPPNNRLVTGGQRGSGWFKKSYRLIAVGVIVAVALVGTWLIIPSGSQHQVAPYHGAATASGIGKYTPPDAVKPAAATPPAGEKTPPSMPPLPNIQPAQIIQRPAVYTFGGSSNLPPYLKKIQEAQSSTAPQAEHAKTGGINFAPVTYAGTKSFTIKDRSLMLMRWSSFICVLDTEIVTGAGGETPFRCHTKYDVLSPMRVVLLEAGTIIGGTYKSVVSEGDSRVIAITAEAQTPNGVIADIGGPIADDLGGAGVPGSVDEHWMKRIGGALILSLIDNVFQMAQAEIQKNSSQTNISLGGGSGGGLSQIGQQLLSKTINIPPTITLNQGTEIALWVTKYIDFSDSYKLETSR